MPVHSTSIKSYPLLHRGKVRDVYQAQDNLLLVATDRISAFDVIMSEPIPGKGNILTSISTFWFDYLRDVVPNHFISTDLRLLNLTDEEFTQLSGRTMIVKRTQPILLECVVRGYISGGGWKDYRTTGSVCGIQLPDNLVESDKLPEPIFTPTTKAAVGHDESVTFDEAAQIVGRSVADTIRTLSLELYRRGAEYASMKGLILADTKFEFGVDSTGDIILIDEVLTPDSSRYWLSSEYQPGKAQHNFDKQILRDYLEEIQWNKQPPPPLLPAEIIEGTRQRYLEAQRMLTGQ